MEIDIVRKNDNPLLGRVEVEFEVSYPKEKTPDSKPSSSDPPQER